MVSLPGFVLSVLVSWAALAQAPFALADKPTSQPAEAVLMKVQRPLSELMDDLDSSDPSRYELARAELMLLDLKDIDQLKTAVGSVTLSRTQLANLQEVVSQIYITGQSPNTGPGWGFLGVHMPPNDRAGDDLRSAVILGRVIGCDAYRVMREGDTVVGMQNLTRGQSEMSPISNYREMRAFLQQTRPGEWIQMRLIRNGEPIERPLRLSLNNGARPIDVTPYQALAEQYWAQQFSPIIRIRPQDD